MSKQALTKSFLAVVVVLMASTVTRTFAQTIKAAVPHHTFWAGDPGSGDPDPTGGTGN